MRALALLQSTFASKSLLSIQSVPVPQGALTSQSSVEPGFTAKQWFLVESDLDLRHLRRIGMRRMSYPMTFSDEL